MTPAIWSAPTVSAPVDATVTLPGSKSLTSRALVLAALSTERSVVRQPLRSADTAVMVRALQALGVGIDDRSDAYEALTGEGRADSWSVIPGVLSGPAHIDVGGTGTVLRFLLPVAALADGDITFDGDAVARTYPLGPLIDALRQLGARIDDGDRGALPLTVQGAGGLVGGRVDVDAAVSSQFVSALLMSAPRFNQGADIRHVGAQLDAGSHIRMTVAMLRRAGVQVEQNEPYRWRVAPGAVRGLNVTIDPDLTVAAPFLAAAVVTRGRVTVAGWPARSSQPGDVIREVFTRMGATCELHSGGLTVTGTEHPHGIDVRLHDVVELAPVVAAVAALADSPSHLRGLSALREAAGDRLAVLVKELGTLGAEVQETDDGLHITPRWLHGGIFSTHGDPRLAAMAAVLGLVVHGVDIENVAAAGKILPDFVSRWERMLRSGR